MKTIYCAVHGYTEWEDELVAVINTPEFQRLKRIRQLAVVHHVFPCATHTRYEHSLGVGFLAAEFGMALQRRHPEIAVDVAALKLAGLCHDLGHGPLSHAYDRFLAERHHPHAEHEARSVAILRRIVTAYAVPLDPVTVERACELIHPTTHALPLFMYQIVANHLDDVDVDKLDYLRRDAQHTGVRFEIDVPRFFQYARVVDGRLCYSRKHMPHAINNLFMVRHQLHARVYQHPAVRAIELMHMDVLRALDAAVSDEGCFHELTDAVFSRDFVELSRRRGLVGDAAADEALELLDRMETRRLYALVHETRLAGEASAKRVRDTVRPSRDFHVDISHIGYPTNPLFRVAFYDEDRPSHRTLEYHSAVFPIESDDWIVRIYDKGLSA